MTTGKTSSPNKRVESDSLRRRFAPPPLAAHAQRWAYKKIGEDAMGYPKYEDLEDPLLCYIYKNGGDKYQVSSDSTYKPLADFFGLSYEERTRTRDEIHHDGRDEPEWNNMVQWARRKLKDQGYLASSPHGKWRLSEKGILVAQKKMQISLRKSERPTRRSSRRRGTAARFLTLRARRGSAQR